MSEPHESVAPAVPPAALPALPLAPVTGDSVVDEAVATLGGVTLVPLDEQPAIYDGVHRALQERLADVEG